MCNFIKSLFIAFAMLIFSSPLMADCTHRNHLSVKGGGTFISPNVLSQGFNANVTKLKVKTRDNEIVKGIFSVSSIAAGPVDSVTGIDFEAEGKIDAIRTFPNHRDVVWIHGVSKGFITFGTDSRYGNLSGITVPLNSVNGEFIGAITTWGRTNFLTVFENNNLPLPNFFTSSEAELTTLVGGFSRIFLTKGARPGKVTIETGSQAVTIPIITNSLKDNGDK